MPDDCTYSDPSVYGGQNARTLAIDSRATQGLTFNKACLCSAMYQPYRAELFTGQYPMRNGRTLNLAASRPDVTNIPHHFGRLAYRVGLAGEVHVAPAKSFPFEPVADFDPDCVHYPMQAHSVAGIREFMTRSTNPFRPVIALVEPHMPWVMGDPSAFPPKQIRLPANLADTPATSRKSRTWKVMWTIFRSCLRTPAGQTTHWCFSRMCRARSFLGARGPAGTSEFTPRGLPAGRESSVRAAHRCTRAVLPCAAYSDRPGGRTAE